MANQDSSLPCNHYLAASQWKSQWDANENSTSLTYHGPSGVLSVPLPFYCRYAYKCFQSCPSVCPVSPTKCEATGEFQDAVNLKSMWRPPVPTGTSGTCIKPMVLLWCTQYLSTTQFCFDYSSIRFIKTNNNTIKHPSSGMVTPSSLLDTPSVVTSGGHTNPLPPPVAINTI